MPCRDALQHLPCKLVVDSLQNFALSRPKWLLVGSYDGNGNQNIPAGLHFAINLREPPYSMADGVMQVCHMALVKCRHPAIR